MLKKPKILVVGSFNMDVIASTGRVPNSGETVIGMKFQTAPGGKGLNQAVQCARLGADVTMVGNDEAGMTQIRQICGEKGADVTIEATGSPQVLTDAIRMVRPGGRVVVGSVYHGTIREFDPLPIFRKELTLVGAKGPTVYRRTDGSSTVMYMMERVQNDLKKIISVYDYKDALKAFEDAKSGEAIKAVITF